MAMSGYFDLDPQVYDWCARAFDHLRKLLGIHIKMHHAHGQLEASEIFLFNHFARVETFIPQFLIYQHSGDYCRSIAAAEFFAGNERFAKLLRDLGVVPNNQPRLMELLARDILRGRKVVVFPEGGMVKDRQVVDARGRYSVYSRHARTRRKHHTGAARLATGLQVFKYAVQYRAARGDRATLDAWTQDLGLSAPQELIEAAARAVTLVPACITFYPLRISDNVLRRGAEMLLGSLSKRAIEELVVEGNILLKPTDMDINLGRSMRIDEAFSWYERLLLRYLGRDLPDLASIFDIGYLDRQLVRSLATYGTNSAINRIRDRYMRDIYQAATVNLSHLASSIILAHAHQGIMEIPERTFRIALYLAVKRLQAHKEVRLHRGLCDPDRYQPILEAEVSALNEFLESAQSAAVLGRKPDKLVLKAKLVEEQQFDEIRLENPVGVYANEVKPLAAVGAAVREAMARAGTASRGELARELFDDEIKGLEWDRKLYSQRKHYEINARETATADPSPFLLVPDEPREVGVVLVHGFLASPAELRAFGHKLYGRGYTTLGVRLKGHGTSPWDLRDRAWQDWLHSVRKGVDIMSALTARWVLVGFSTGGSLSLILASEEPDRVAGVVAVCPPLKFGNKNMRFVPLMHGANRVVNWLSSYEGVMPFRVHESEHPLINYRNMPLRGLYELTRVTGQLHQSLANVRCPTCLIQSTGDRVVDPASVGEAHARLTATYKEMHWVESDRHGILHEDIGHTQQIAVDFIGRVERRETGPEQAVPAPPAPVAVVPTTMDQPALEP